jgi:hypothetical protein
MKADTAWVLKVSPRVNVSPEPTEKEPEVLCTVDATNVFKSK